MKPLTKEQIRAWNNFMKPSRKSPVVKPKYKRTYDPTLIVTKYRK